MSALQAEERIQEGQRLGRIVRLDSLQEAEVVCPVSGLIFRNGVVRPGKHETYESLSPVVEENDSIAVVFALT